MTQIDRARRDASNGPSLVKYGQHMDDIERNNKIEEVKSDQLGIRSTVKMIIKKYSYKKACMKDTLANKFCSTSPPDGNQVDGLPSA